MELGTVRDTSGDLKGKVDGYRCHSDLYHFTKKAAMAKPAKTIDHHCIGIKNRECLCRNWISRPVFLSITVLNWEFKNLPKNQQAIALKTNDGPRVQ